MNVDRKVARAAKLAATAKFKRIAALNRMIDAKGEEAPGARKARKALADHWEKRTSRNVHGLWRPNGARHEVRA